MVDLTIGYVAGMVAAGFFIGMAFFGFPVFESNVRCRLG